MPEEVLPENWKIKAGASASAGVRLREERLSKGIKTSTVAEKLHITNHYVKAIESDSFEKLPGAIFIRGYLKNYAELLNLNPSRLLVSMKTAHKTLMVVTESFSITKTKTVYRHIVCHFIYYFICCSMDL